MLEIKALQEKRLMGTKAGRNGVFKGRVPWSAGGEGKMRGVLSSPLRLRTKPSPPTGDSEDGVQKPCIKVCIFQT